MSYIGKGPGEHFTSFQTETFSVSATTSYTLSYAVANENELALFINNVRQQPGSGKAYTASGTALTLSAATASTDSMYGIYLGRALQTITPSTNSITSSMLGSNFFTGATDIGGAIADADLILMDDGAGGTLRKSAASRLKTYIGGTTPAFSAYSADNQTISDATWTKVELDTEEYDSDGTFATHRFTPAVAGYYFIYGRVNVDTAHNTAGAADVHMAIYKNGSSYTSQQQRWLGYPQRNPGVSISATLSLDDDDYVELYAYCDDGQDSPVIDGGTKQIWFTGFKV